ncbi:tyrosine-protein kinase JAK1-like [Physella acuta]|uniref:tyrosine-protein kinase JAK1-like n=1 Tax=Physella acuta TaxID=109671 RepID=UPI0027DBCA6E|nr:tyrosine-protein kinase JAK1-like [Physella acuta]XP_059179265.1 tyrosine-protein kinase JAK1-like [Physella acuta]XP_059179266.1 tyrosine-protein kinase JAK1-like [Physella acuta]XP_059179267.1 tyrosine-protein kinase JAK1-like [Physella acuta]
MPDNSTNTSDSIKISFVHKGILPKIIPTNVEGPDLTYYGVLQICLQHIYRTICANTTDDKLFGPQFEQMFGLLMCPEENNWLPHNYVFAKTSEKPRNYMLKVRFRPPPSSSIFDLKNNVMLEYLILQMLDEFLTGKLGESKRFDDKKLFTILTIAMLFPKNLPLDSSVTVDQKYREPPIRFWRLDRLFSKYIRKRLISQKIIDHYWICNGLKDNIRKMKQTGQKLYYYKKLFYDKIVEAEPTYWVEQYEAFSIGNNGCLDKVTVTINLIGENHQPALFYGEVLQCMFLEIFTIKLEGPKNLLARAWTVLIELKNEAPKHLQFEQEEAAKSFISMVQGFFWLYVRYDICLSLELQTAKAKMNHDLVSFGPLAHETAESFLKDHGRLEPGKKIFLIHESLSHYKCYDVVVYCISGNEAQFQRHLIECSDDRTFKLIKGSDRQDIVVYDSHVELKKHLKDTIGSQINPTNYPMVAEVNKFFQLENIEPYEQDQSIEDKVSNDPGIYLREDVCQGWKHIKDKNPFIKKYEVVIKSQKMLLLELQSEDGKMAEAFRGGIQDLMKLHKCKPANFLKFYGVLWEKKMCVLMEYAPHSDLLTFICTHPQTVKQKVEIMYQIIKILDVMKENKLYHGSIRLRRFMVFQNKPLDQALIKLGHSGISSYLDSLPDDVNNIDRYPWLSPERRNNLATITYESECYAVGTTLCEMIYRNDQFHVELNLTSCKELKDYLMDKCIPKPKAIDTFVQESDNSTLDEGAALAPEAKVVLEEVWDRVIAQCWLHDPIDRPSPRSLINIFDDIRNKADEISFDTHAEVLKDVFYDDIKEEINETVKKQLTLEELQNILQEKLKHKFLKNECVKTTKDQVLGQGHFGVVYEGEVREPVQNTQQGSGTEWKRCAVKMFNKGVTDNRNLLKEIKIACELDHPNIVKVWHFTYYNINTKFLPIALIMEFMTEGNLGKFAEKHKDFVSQVFLDKLLKICIGVAEGMVYLSGKEIVHRDLAARNILLTKQGPDVVAKVSDFGLARNMEEKYRFYRNKPESTLPALWMPPECLSSQSSTSEFTTKGDVFSFGIAIWEAFYKGFHPRIKIGKIHNKNNLHDELYAKYHAGFRLPQKPYIHDKLYSIMLKCWQLDPKQRPAFVELVLQLKALQGQDLTVPTPQAGP